MTILTGDFRDIAGVKSSGTVTITSTVVRPALDGSGETVTRELHHLALEDGQFVSPELDPGPVVVELSAGAEWSQWHIDLPASGTHDVGSLIDQQTEWSPPVVLAAQAARDLAIAAAKTATTAAESVDGVITQVNAHAQAAAGDAERAEQQASTAAVAADVAQMAGSDAVAAAESSADDRRQTGEDRASTGEDRQAVEAARTTAVDAASSASGEADRAKAEADRAESEADRAEAAAGAADGAAIEAVTRRVDELLEGAPDAYDTLREVADKLAAQDDVASVLTTQIAQKAGIVHSHDIADVTGLQVALDAKASKGYVDEAVASAVGDVDLSAIEQQIALKADKAYVDASASSAATAAVAAKIQVVTSMPSNPTPGVFYATVGSTQI